MKLKRGGWYWRLQSKFSFPSLGKRMALQGFNRHQVRFLLRGRGVTGLRRRLVLRNFDEQKRRNPAERYERDET